MYRARLGREDQSLTYGEVEFQPFLELLQAAGAHHGDHFFDLVRPTELVLYCLIITTAFTISLHAYSATLLPTVHFYAH